MLFSVPSSTDIVAFALFFVVDGNTAGPVFPIALPRYHLFLGLPRLSVTHL